MLSPLLPIILFATPLVPIDYADSTHVESWLHHPVVGEVSFDSFERVPGNPAHRGAGDHAWPVNGFRFRDPVSGGDYLYVGEYASGYALTPSIPSRCVVLRAKAEGGWDNLGPIFGPEPHVFAGETSRVFHAPDVSVVHFEGRYHLCYDWTTENTTWENASNPPADVNSGVGYAWAERPEGPFHQVARPIATTRGQVPLLGKYKRLYASTLVRRAQDWLVLTLTDSGANFGWALLGMSSPNPEGPYTEPQMLLFPESARYLPPLLEYFPAFTHEGYLYAPATSVGRNRNYQALFRVPIEQALDAAAWEGVQFGSLWHAEPVEHETAGLWGQTFSGYVDDNATLRVLFPSRDANNLGTINVAQRPWAQPLRARGFVASAHGGDSLALLRRGGPAQRVDVALTLRGKVTLVWDATMPIGPNEPRSDSVPHAQTLAHHTGLQLSVDSWELYGADAPGTRAMLQQGTYALAGATTLAIAWSGEDEGSITINGQEAWVGSVPNGPGMFGLLLAPGSWAEVTSFEITGGSQSAPPLDYLYTEGLVGAAQNMTDWQAVEDPNFRFGIGAVSASPTVRAKWNFEGSGFALWGPRAPGYGRASVLVDGEAAGVANFHHASTKPSGEVFRLVGLSNGRHTVALEPIEGCIALDSLTVDPAR